MTDDARCIWLTGRVGAGKSTLGRGAADALRERGRPVALLDESDLAEHLTYGPTAGGIAAVVWLVRLLVDAGATVLVTVDIPDRATREALRDQIPDFIEVLVDASADECARRGASIAADYEEPLVPDLRIPTGDRDARASIAQLVALLDPDSE